VLAPSAVKRAARQIERILAGSVVVFFKFKHPTIDAEPSVHELEVRGLPCTDGQSLYHASQPLEPVADSGRAIGTACDTTGY
jgi:hypothetical protein